MRLCSKPGTIKEASAAQRQRKRRRLLRSARSNATGGSSATMQQAGYKRRAERDVFKQINISINRLRYSLILRDIQDGFLLFFI